MSDKIIENNQVSIIGEVVSGFVFSHEVFGEGFYMLDVSVRRVLPQLSVFAFLYYRRYSIINISKDMREAVKCQVYTVHYV